ncbi:MAG: VUT family protein [Rhodospirillales bacterium]|nr:VUT family protein [Rhodospirillales bacterium]
MLLEDKAPPMRIPFTLLYIALIVAVNYAFTVVPLVELPDGTKWPPVSLLVGFVFVARDFAQREIGHRVLLAMLVGVGISYFMANPFVAAASAAAFLVSELADWAVYTFTKRPFSERVLYSSVLGAPIDSAVFLGGIGILTPVGVIAMTASKLLGALIVWWMVRRREQAA